jgi:MFS family permease
MDVRARIGARDGLTVAAAVVFAVTAIRAVTRMGPLPDVGCSMSPTCPNSHQWWALLVLAFLCGMLAVITGAALVSRWTAPARPAPARLPVVAAVMAVAIALVAVDPPGHLNSPHADWFGHSLDDSSL